MPAAVGSGRRPRRRRRAAGLPPAAVGPPAGDRGVNGPDELVGLVAEVHLDVLDTGDPAISKDDQLVIAADPKNRRYFLVPGDSTNLAYLDDQPLLESCELRDKAVIQIGETKMLFIQLFGNYLDWT